MINSGSKPRVLFIFLDGIGLGEDNPAINPFARADLPCLQGFLGGKKLLGSTAHSNSQRATLIALDASMGVSGLPQSATGQATLLTGRNIPAAIGYHYGPKPNPAVAETLEHGGLFQHFSQNGHKAALLNAYPPRYFTGISSRRRLYSAIPLAVTNAGLSLKTLQDLKDSKALSADFTGQGWRDNLGIPEAPVLTPLQAGRRLAELAQDYNFSFFEYWLSDYAGHHQDMAAACDLLETFDQVLAGLLATWDDSEGLVLITSDHGNMEDLSTRRHTLNRVPALIIGSPELRRAFAGSLQDLTGVTPAILRLLS
jgi:2,3-bisphosphoglycerate-independent phosphoglycerate mutase